MAKDNGTTTTSADDGGMTSIVMGEATALGQDTLASVDATSSLTLTGNGNVTKAKGEVTATAVGDAYANTHTDVDIPGADKIHIKTSTISGEQNGVSYEISVTTFKAMDHQNKDDETKIKIQDKSPDIDHQGHDNADLTIQLDDNVATVTFDAQASADNSLVQVEASVLAVQDELSVSAVMIHSEVG
jgi:hypothetical protein